MSARRVAGRRAARSVVGRRAARLVLFTLALAAPRVGAFRPAEAAEPFEEFDRRITAELEAIDPEAARLFREANAERAKERHAEASSLYARVYEKVPTFVHALRRQCTEEQALGHRPRAITLCRAAVSRDESATNLAALARVLAARTETFQPTSLELDEAVPLADRAVALAPDDIYTHISLCEVAVGKNDLELLRRCTTGLGERFPRDPATHVYLAVLAASEGRFLEAERDLRRARELGLPEEAYRSILGSVRRSEPITTRMLPLLLPVVVAWLACLLVLFFLGFVLSRAALRVAGRPAAGASAGVGGLDALLRRVYRVVLWASCGYYWASLPLLFLVVLGLGGALLYGMFAFGRIPVKLAFLVAVLTLVTLWAILKSLFVRSANEDPGERLDLARYSKLRALLDEVAERVGTRPVDNVYLVPGTTVAVMERTGRGPLGLARHRERCLILGVGVLDGFRLGPLKAVLAHEYGHFSNRDTAGGGFALSVRRSLLTMAHNIARGGAAAWYNPAWLFVNGFYRVFLRISEGASRLQEVLADRWAALMYGSEAFEKGLRHVIERTVRFGAHVQSTLTEVVEGKKPLRNLYDYHPAAPSPEKDLDKAVRAALEAPPSPYDSHPSPKDRVAWVRNLAAPGSSSSMDDSRDAWTLFPDREAIEAAMTGVVRDNVMREHGIAIAPAAGS